MHAPQVRDLAHFLGQAGLYILAAVALGFSLTVAALALALGLSLAATVLTVALGIALPVFVVYKVLR